MRLLDSQINQIFERVDDSAFHRHQIAVTYVPVQTSYDTDEEDPVLRFRADPQRTCLRIQRVGIKKYRVSRSPGANTYEDAAEVAGWDHVLDRISDWLSLIKREISAAERRSEDSLEVPPEWALNALPAEYADAVKQIAELQETERRMRRMAGLLWELSRRDPTSARKQLQSIHTAPAGLFRFRFEGAM